jgi:YD repeat-containing protein
MRELLTILFISVLFFSCKEKKANNDWGKMNLHGRVKMIREADYFLDTTGSDKGKKLRWTDVYVFNTTGNITHTFRVDDKGDTGQQMIYEYDSAGRIKRQLIFYNAVDVKSARTYFYDSIGNNILSIETRGITTENPEGYIETKFLNRFNAQKLLIHQTVLLGPPVDGRFSDSMVIQFTYDKQGRLSTDRTAHTDSTVTNAMYTYDDNNNCILEQRSPINPHDAVKIVRTFDKEGNLLEEASYEEFKDLHSKKTIEYLKPDKQGNWTEQRIHWHDLGTTVLERTIEYYP